MESHLWTIHWQRRRERVHRKGDRIGETGGERRRIQANAAPDIGVYHTPTVREHESLRIKNELREGKYIHIHGRDEYRSQKKSNRRE